MCGYSLLSAVKEMGIEGCHLIATFSFKNSLNLILTLFLIGMNCYLLSHINEVIFLLSYIGTPYITMHRLLHTRILLQCERIWKPLKS